ncbi:protein-tyrosine phosphatase [Hamiltosporidium tvaerminnensis]|uniref:Protein-tyrosine phosphatase n=1 Tax=Hamiltosporidium tvaerminnensis TaxID=1176355 RepID=A0A4Q9LQ48_9MICR|nr:protein-tyrosine phosphatase [Hamiltosporidium tvaerminnensis]
MTHIFKNNILNKYGLCSDEDREKIIIGIESKVYRNVVSRNFREVIRVTDKALENLSMKMTPYDICSVVTPYNDEIQEMFGIGTYINASYIPTDLTHYIACQFPKKEFIHLFIKLITKSNTKLIISLIDCKEYDYLENFKCIDRDVIKDEYDNDLFFDETYKITEKYFLRRLRFFKWKDFDIPTKSDFLKFYNYFNDIRSEDTNIIIHCKAGAGRTGAFIFYDILKHEKNVDNFIFTRKFLYLRYKRPRMVYNDKQLQYIAGFFLK